MKAQVPQKRGGNRESMALVSNTPLGMLPYLLEPWFLNREILCILWMTITQTFLDCSKHGFKFHLEFSLQHHCSELCFNNPFLEFPYTPKKSLVWSCHKTSHPVNYLPRPSCRLQWFYLFTCTVSASLVECKPHEGRVSLIHHCALNS